MLVIEYLALIIEKYLPKKTFGIVDDIVLYTHNKEVYKVVVRYYPCKRFLKKLGINHHLIFLNDFPKETLTDDIIQTSNKNNLLIVFNRKSQTTTVQAGEERVVKT